MWLAKSSSGGMTDTKTTGYQMQTQTSTTSNQIGANEVPNYNADQVHQNGMEYSVNGQTTSTTMAPTTVHHYSVPTAPKTERCNVGVLPPTGETAKVSTAMTSTEHQTQITVDEHRSGLATEWDVLGSGRSENRVSCRLRYAGMWRSPKLGGLCSCA